MKEHELRVKEILDPIIDVGGDAVPYMKFRRFLVDLALKADNGNRSAKELLDLAERFSKLVKIGIKCTHK